MQVNQPVDIGIIGGETLPDKVAERILHLIEEKHLLPGDRLPPERELAEMMGVSRPILREALRALSFMRVIENRRRVGSFITSLKPELLVERLEFVFSLDDSTYLDVLQARKVVEAGLAELAAINITEDEIKQLESCLERSAAVIDDPAQFLQVDLELHSIVSTAARNRILERFMASIVKLGIHSRSRTSQLADVRARTMRDHQVIVAALKAHDPQAASQAMRQHISFVEQRLKESMFKIR